MEKTETEPGVRVVKKHWLAACVACAVVLVAGLAAWLASDSRSRRKDAAEPSVSEKGVCSRSADADYWKEPCLKESIGTVLAADDDEGADEAWTSGEKSLFERIEKALDDEDFELAVVCAEEAQKCGVAKIRQSMVDTLGWFGEKALPELTPFLADADDDVRESAMNEWTMALSSIEDESIKIRTVELAMWVLKDEDALEDVSNEYIGVDEKLAVESLARIIEGGGSSEGIEKAKETYEFVTGDEWTGADEAERWIAEEYEPPEAE